MRTHLFFCLWLFLCASAHAQCDPAWRSGPNQGIPGLDNAALCSTTWDPDGAGPLPSVLVVGGTFATAGDVSASRIATWDGQDWSTLGAGFDGSVNAVAVFDGNLYAAGSFTNSGATPVTRIARWDGTNWHPLGAGFTNQVNALAAYNGELYAGGIFNSFSGSPFTGIARWNGSIWQSCGSGFVNSVTIRCMTVYAGELVVGGTFVSVGGLTANNLARWNGSTWQTIATGTGGAVYALATYETDLYIGGDFTTVSGISARRVARWNGSVWSALGNGANDLVNALAFRGTLLYAGGRFVNGTTNNYLALWDGSVWSPLGLGPRSTPQTITVYNNDVIAGGSFTPIGMYSAAHIIRWDGINWWPLTSNVSERINCSTVFNNQLVVGTNSVTAGNVRINGIAAWDGSWHAFGIGVGVCFSVAVYNNQLYASGIDVELGRWNGVNWEGVGYPGIRVNCMTVFDGKLIVSELNSSPTRVWQYNGISWLQLGSPFSASNSSSNINAMCEYQGELYAGGNFSHAGSVVANRIARWNGSSWEAVGSGVLGLYIYALTVYNDRLIACGLFSSAGGNPAENLAQWDGSTWSALGGGVISEAFALYAIGSDLYVGGSFNTAGGIPANRVARWDGVAWNALQNGLGSGTNFVFPDDFTLFHNELIATGSYVGGAGNTRSFWARWGLDGSPWVTTHPQPVTLFPGQTATFSAAAAGYSGLSYQWRRNSLPLSDGPSGNGETITGATAATLSVQGTTFASAGSFERYNQKLWMQD